MSDATEEWRPIPGFEGHYEASSRGRVRSTKGGKVRVLKPGTRPNGYLYLNLCVDGTRQRVSIHRLICLTFHGAPPDKHAQACHYDGSRTNNVPSNLRWDTARGNAADRERHGRQHNSRKTHCKRGHAFTPENTCIRAGTNHRRCRACGAGYERAKRRNALADNHSLEHPQFSR